MKTHALETRIPPPVVGLSVALLMWALNSWWPFEFESVWRTPLALLLVAVGAGLDLAGLWAFRRARTTINPLKPQRTSALVSGGVYRLTRNPMYLGMLCLLLAWAVYLGQPGTLLGPVVFVAYMTRFQIVPEERAIRERFGPEFDAYCARVRRWL